MKLTKLEINAIRKYNKDFEMSTDKPNGKIMNSLIVVVHDTRILHDSGYPLIKIIGIGEDKKYYDLGYHDHYIVSVPVNVDSFGKNVFHIMNWNDNTPFKVSDSFISCSTFQIGNYPSEVQNKEWTVLR